jgi:hypothetical protein
MHTRIGLLAFMIDSTRMFRIGLLSVLVASPALAGNIVGVSNNGCEGDNTPYTYAGVTTVVFSAPDPYHLTVTTNAYERGPVRVCYIDITMEMDDTTDPVIGPQQSTDPTVIWEELQHQIHVNTPNININQHLGPARAPAPAAVTGHRDYVLPSGGFTLSTGTPGYASFLVSGLNEETYVPFIVDSLGTGSSLSIYGPGGVLWSQPLSEFTPDTLYLAALAPQTTDSSVPEELTYWLHSTTSGTASVYFPETVTAVASVTEPATLSLLAVGLVGLGVMRRRNCRAHGKKRTA